MAVIETVQVDVVDQAEGFRILDDAARRHLSMTGAEFIEAWDAGKLADRADTPEVIRVVMLIPFSR